MSNREDTTMDATITDPAEIAGMIDKLITLADQQRAATGAVAPAIAVKIAELRERFTSDYRPGRARVGEATPQSHPHLFTDAAIRAEVKYLLRLNKRYGTHVLRVAAYVKLAEVLRARGA